MTTPRTVLLLVGSGKPSRSTSEALGSFLCGRLRDRGWGTEALRIAEAVRTEEGTEALLAATDRADLVVLAFPLFADSLPYPATRAMERLAFHRKVRERGKGQRLLALVNCGFPEAAQCETALAICRAFAREAGFGWAGGLALGGGASIDGVPLPEAGRRARLAIRALTLAAEALAQGREVPAEAVATMARPFVPGRLYTWMGTAGWRSRARRLGTKGRLYDRPYAE